jgi:hypothetical protein
MLNKYLNNFYIKLVLSVITFLSTWIISYNLTLLNLIIQYFYFNLFYLYFIFIEFYNYIIIIYEIFEFFFFFIIYIIFLISNFLLFDNLFKKFLSNQLYNNIFLFNITILFKNLFIFNFFFKNIHKILSKFTKK